MNLKQFDQLAYRFLDQCERQMTDQEMADHHRARLWGGNNRSIRQWFCQRNGCRLLVTEYSAARSGFSRKHTFWFSGTRISFESMPYWVSQTGAQEWRWRQKPTDEEALLAFLLFS